MKQFKAKNGEVLIAINEVQEAAFLSAGLEPVKEDSKKKDK
jgi:hypothetical protein